jgi:hypothetical protein
MAFLKLTHPTSKVVLQHPRLKGKDRIGRGAFCIVFDNGSTVLKLTRDKFQYAIYTNADRPSGVFFPTMISDFGVIGGTEKYPLYLVEMEKLSAFSRKSSAPLGTWEMRQSLISALDKVRVEQCLWRTQSHLTGGEFESLATMESIRGAILKRVLPDEILGALQSLYHFCERTGCGPDFHRSNFMFRGNQLVLNDVVKDHRIAYRLSNRQLRPIDYDGNLIVRE